MSSVSLLRCCCNQTSDVIKLRKCKVCCMYFCKKHGCKYNRICLNCTCCKECGPKTIKNLEEFKKVFEICDACGEVFCKKCKIFFSDEFRSWCRDCIKCEDCGRKLKNDCIIKVCAGCKSFVCERCIDTKHFCVCVMCFSVSPLGKCDRCKATFCSKGNTLKQCEEEHKYYCDKHLLFSSTDDVWKK